jgi:predicted exporter
MHGISVTIDGHELSDPIGGLVEVWGVMVAGVVLFCVAVLLVFVFVGVGLVVVGTLVLVGLILAAVALPFMLPLLIPLFILWLFCCAVRKSKA